MINYYYEIDFSIADEPVISDWIEASILNEKCTLGEINYIFCTDEYLYNLNVEFLGHDTLTDIISFDYSIGKELHGDVYISMERVVDNAKDYNVMMLDELHRVMIHGVLHYCGYMDKTEDEAKVMKTKENFYLDRR